MHKIVPDNLFVAYKRYKEDTYVFVTWLYKQTVACGFKEVKTTQAQARSGTRLKGKARQAAKTLSGGSGTQSNAIKVSTRGILVLAQMIEAYRPCVKVPAHVQVSLLRAIKARKRCAALYESKVGGGITVDEYSNAAHKHFIEILDQCFTILRPRFEILQASKIESSKSSHSSPSTKKQGIESTQNRFEKLSLESCNEKDLDDSAINTTASMSSQGPIKPRELQK
ncbi:hypothetical protein BKA64DRAFT_778811 [Cadophora sp. MPI-SDFR-AT-0126]|nr:hypothetical protein BKA64DRAFT_778811 [Leotiomycetes sp. MPI-SDFR-AT-0126]